MQILSYLFNETASHPETKHPETALQRFQLNQKNPPGILDDKHFMHQREFALFGKFS